jgi:hypothetical protein
VERVGEILNSIKERLANPFVFSFLVAWSVYHWPIFIVLFGYSPNELAMAGYRSSIAFIQDRISQEGSIQWPIIYALAITLSIPVLRVLFTTFNAWVTRIGNDLFFWISRRSHISTEKYLSLRDDYLRSLRQLEKVIKDEANYETKYRELDLRSKQLLADSERLMKMSEDSFMNGTWDLSYKTITKRKILKVFGQNVQTSDDTALKLPGQNENLVFFSRDIREPEKLTFIVSSNDPGIGLAVYSLTKAGVDRYEGVENYKMPIVMIRSAQ